MHLGDFLHDFLKKEYLNERFDQVKFKKNKNEHDEESTT